MTQQYQYRITLPQPVGEAIERISAQTGRTPPKIIREWLTEAEEAFLTVADAMEKASTLQGAVKEDFLAGFMDAAQEILDMKPQLDDAMDRLSEGNGRDRVGAPRRVCAGATEPPSCNTGATKSNQTIKSGG